jgi:hypothetical protein
MWPPVIWIIAAIISAVEGIKRLIRDGTKVVNERDRIKLYVEH